jgi:hypothetical protein
MSDACDGKVSGTVAYAWRNRRPRAASALNAGVETPTASGPIASARVVSRVIRRMDARVAGAGFAGGGVDPPHAEPITAHATIADRRKDVGASALTT